MTTSLSARCWSTPATDHLPGASGRARRAGGMPATVEARPVGRGGEDAERLLVAEELEQAGHVVGRGPGARTRLVRILHQANLAAIAAANRPGAAASQLRNIDGSVTSSSSSRSSPPGAGSRSTRAYSVSLPVASSTRWADGQFRGARRHAQHPSTVLGLDTEIPRGGDLPDRVAECPVEVQDGDLTDRGDLGHVRLHHHVALGELLRQERRPLRHGVRPHQPGAPRTGRHDGLEHRLLPSFLPEHAREVGGLAAAEPAGRHDRDAARRQFPEIVLVGVPADQRRGVPHGPEGGDPVDPGHEGRDLVGIVPGGPHHDEVVVRPGDRRIVPDEGNAVDAGGAQGGHQGRVFDIEIRQGGAGGQGDSGHRRDVHQRKGDNRMAGHLAGHRTIGTAGFEPATPATPLQCATRLRYVP